MTIATGCGARSGSNPAQRKLHLPDIRNDTPD
jgi:hypothetical protein